MDELLLKCIRGITTAVKAVYDRFQQVDSNNVYCKRILSNVRELERLSVELQNIGDSDISDLVQENLMKVNDSLSQVASICSSKISQEVFKRMIDASSEHAELIRLDSNTQRARETLQMTVQFATYNQGRQIKEIIKKESREVKNIVQHVEAGIYINPSVSRPEAVENFNVSPIPEGDLVEIKWKDCKNEVGSIERYEIKFDDETSEIIPLPTSRIAVVDDIFCIRLGEPRLTAGRIYTLQIRAVSGSGPGDWSETLTFRFKAGPPARPQKPKLVVTSPTEVIVEVKTLSREGERGTSVTHCEIQYIEPEENDAIVCEWSSLTVALKQRIGKSDTKKFKIGSLKPHKKYNFRVKMVNSAGKSDPSEAVVIITDCLIPGPPKNVRISSKRTSDSLKVRWDPPTCNPEGVKNYVVQYRLLKSTEWESSAIVDSNKLSHRFTELKSDTFYEFLVKTQNYNGDGDSSDLVKGKTRYGAIKQGLATIGAFAGEIVLDTLMFPIGTVGRAAVVGILPPVKMNKLFGSLDISPWTSDDEEAPV